MGNNLPFGTASSAPGAHSALRQPPASHGDPSRQGSVASAPVVTGSLYSRISRCGMAELVTSRAAQGLADHESWLSFYRQPCARSCVASIILWHFQAC